MDYRFYGWEGANARPVSAEYEKVSDPRHLYDLLCTIWCAQTCAPRLRGGWSMENQTLGQCSITAFLVQDIFGGEVLGIPLQGGGVHCLNKAGGCLFDLTSEQFGDEKLDYSCCIPQSRDVHFADPEKYNRYLYLKNELLKRL